MINPFIEEHIPAELKQLPIWTFTRTDFDKKLQKDLKVPMDPINLDLGVYKGISSINNLVTFDQLKAVRNVPDNWLPAFYLQANKNHWLMVDIEPGGMKPNNELLYYDYPYVEASRHDGLHGLIHLDSNHDFMSKTAVKAHDIDSEFLINRHFVTLTGKAPSKLYQPHLKKHDTQWLIDFIDQCDTSAVIDNTIQTNVSLDDAQQKLSPNAQALYDELNLSKIKRPDDVDISQWEFTQIAKHFHELPRYHGTKFAKLSIEEQVAVLYKATLNTLPTRKKHNRKFNDNQHGDQVNWLFYTVRKIVETNQPS